MELRGPSWRGRRVHTPSRLPTGHAGPWSLCPVGGQPTKTGPLTGWGGQDTPGIPDTAEATIRDAGAAGCCLLRLQERVPPASASLCPPHPPPHVPGLWSPPSNFSVLTRLLCRVCLLRGHLSLGLVPA